jgi:hypothetical protein
MWITIVQTLYLQKTRAASAIPQFIVEIIGQPHQ